MFKIDSAGASPDHEFLDNAVGVAGTVVSADWLNAVQRELLAILAAAGIAPSKVDDNQVIEAIEQLIAAGGGGGGGGGSQFWRDAVATTGDLPTGVNTGTICLVMTTNVLYRYNGSAWVVFYKASDFLAVGTTSDAVAEGSTNKYFTDERAQDAIGAMLADSPTIDVTYNDAGNAETFAVLPSGIEINSLAATTPLSLAKGGSGGTTAQAGTETFGGMTPTLINSNTTAVRNREYLVDTTSGSVTLTLPPLVAGSRIKITDIAAKWGTNSVIVAPATGEKFQGLAANATKTFSVLNGWAVFYANGTTEWGVETTIPGLQGSQMYGGYQTSTISTATNLVNGTWYLTNTTSAGFTGTLPSGSAGMRVKITDDKETWDVNPFVLAPFTGQTIGQNAANVTITCNIKRGWIEVVHDGTTWVILSFASTVLSSGSGLTGVTRTAATAATSGNMYECDTTSGAFTVTLPGGTTPAVVGVLDAGPFFSTNNLIVAPATGQSIDTGAANDTITFDQNRQSCIFYRANGSTVWEIQTASNTAVPEAGLGVSGYVSNTTQVLSGDKQFADTVTLGADTVSSITGKAHIFHGGINSGGTGTSANQRALLLNANAYNPNAYGRARAAGTGGFSIVMLNTIDSTFACQFIANLAADGATTSPQVVGGISNTGAWTLPLIHNLGSGNLTSGTTTSTTGNSGVANVSSITQNRKQFLRVGNEVSCSINFNISSTGAGLVQFDVGLPIASALAATTELNGSGAWISSTVTGPVYVEAGNIAGTRTARVIFTASSATSFLLSATFLYEVK